MYVQKLALWLCLMSTTVSAFAGDVLRYSTPAQVQVGPFGQTNWRGTWVAETDLADSMEVLLASNGGAMLPRFSAAKIEHRGNGFYSIPVDADDVGDFGTLEVVVFWSGQPVSKTCRVVNALTWDEQYTPVKVRVAAEANVTQWLGNAVSATISGKPEVDIYAVGGGTGAAGNLEDAFDGSTSYAFGGWVIPNVTTVNGLGIGVITSTAIATDAITAAKIAANAIGFDEISSSAIGADEIGTNAIGASEIATDAIGSTEIALNAIGSAELAASAVDEIVIDVKTELDTHGGGSWVDTGGGDATAANQTTIISALTTIDNYVDSEVAAILDDTDLIDDVTSGLAKIATDVAAILVDTNSTIPGTLTTIDNYIDSEVQAILDDTNELQTDDVPGLLSTIRGIDSDTLETLSDQIDAVYTGTPPTAAQIRSEMDSNSTDLNTLISGVDVTKIQGHALAGTGTYIADSFEHFFNQATRQYNINTPLSSFKADVTDMSTQTYVASRTLATADYFLFGSDTVANVTTTGNVSGNVDGNVTGSVGSISGITFPTNFDDLAITVTTGYVTVGTNNDKDDYTLTGAIDDFDALLPQLDTEHGDGNWTTAVGFSTHSAANVWSVGTRELSGTYGNFDELLPRLDTEHGDGAWTTGGGDSAKLLSTTVATVDSQTQVTLAAGSDQDDAYSGAIVILTDASNSSYPSIRTVTDYVGSTKTLVIDAAPGFTSDMIAGDGVNVFIAERTLDQAAAIDGKTLRQAIRYLGAVLAGETSGAGTGTEVFKGLDGLTDRLQVFIDANGDRNTINYDP